jgi:hypothetical protein
MKTLVSTSMILCLFLLSSCKKSEDSPVAPEAPPLRKISFSKYGSQLDASYYKAWSDSSWEKYKESKVINGAPYVAILTSAGNTYFYNEFGYAGYQPANLQPIIFDSPISLPDTLTFGVPCTIQTSFYYQSNNYTMKQECTARDTVNVSIPLGFFTGCLWVGTKNTLSAGGQSQSDTSVSWMAVGPSTIKGTSNSGSTVVMVRGRVNGKGWNMAFPKTTGTRDIKSQANPSQDILDVIHPPFLFVGGMSAKR